MKLFMHALDKTVFEGDSSTIVMPSEAGEISVLDGHVPMVTALKKGVVKIKNADNADFISIDILGGFAEINHERVIILLNSKERL